MLVYDYKLDGAPARYTRIASSIRVAQFVRSRRLLMWMDTQGFPANALQAHCSQLATDFAFAAAAQLNAQARQASADRAWAAIQRFYANCRAQTLEKERHPHFQHDNRLAENKATGWKLNPAGNNFTFTDACGAGRLNLVAPPTITPLPLPQIIRGRRIGRADGNFFLFCVDAHRTLAHQATGRQVGIDLGLKAFYTDADGQTVHSPRFLRHAGRRIRSLQRQVSRSFSPKRQHAKQPQSHNY